MDIKKLIIEQINRIKLNNSYNKNDLNYLQKILILKKYKIILNTNYNSDIEYIIKQLSMDHLCKLFIDGCLNFIIKDYKIEYYDVEIITLYLLNMKNCNLLYCNFILLDE